MTLLKRLRLTRTSSSLKCIIPCVSVSSRLQCKHWLTLRMATLQGNKHKEGVHLVVPPEFANFFIAGASAGAALVGLLFVAVSIAPERMVTRRAPIEHHAVPGSAFPALIHPFLLSLASLIPPSTSRTPLLPLTSLRLPS